MKKYFFVVAILLGVMFVGTSFTLAEDGEASVAGTWNAFGLWLGSASPWNFTWTIVQSGSNIQVTSSSGGVATGVAQGKTVRFQFAGGCGPLYVGINATGRSLGGIGICTDGSGGELGWMASRVSATAGEPEFYYDGGGTESSPE